MAFAVVTGLLIVNLVQPGAESDLLHTEFFQQAVGSSASSVEHTRPLGEFLLITVYDVLANPFASMAEGKIAGRGVRDHARSRAPPARGRGAAAGERARKRICRDHAQHRMGHPARAHRDRGASTQRVVTGSVAVLELVVKATARASRMP